MKWAIIVEERSTNQIRWVNWGVKAKYNGFSMTKTVI